MEIKDKITNYQTGKNYTSIKVSFYLKSPLYLTSPWLNLDGIVQYLCLRDALNEDFYNLPTHTTLNLNNLMLPIKKSYDVYRSSVGLFNIQKVFIDKCFKRFTDKQSFKLNKKNRRRKIRINSGYFKDYLIDLPAILTEKVDFYTCADRNSLTDLLDNLTGLGKKTSIGGGRIKEINTEILEEDYSLYKDGVVMRPIPAQTAVDKFHIPFIEGVNISKQNYKPPYWSKTNPVLCFTPPNQLLEVLENA